jgi:subtilisin family serine protease
MSHCRYAHRLIVGLLCVLFSAALTSCGSKASSAAESAPSSESQSSATNTQFVTHLTRKGTGLVRSVPALEFTDKTTIKVSDSVDIRWLNCPLYLDKGQLGKLKDSIPNITFNSETVWPKDLPSGYDPSAIMNAGKNPGLGVDALHNEGITGKGVSVAIIDQPLLTDHREYKDNLALYEEIHVMPDESSSTHGPAVASIAVGKSCGVAPDAKLFYWAIDVTKDLHNQGTDDANTAFADGEAAAIDRMLAVNDTLPPNEKIRVLSISRGFTDLKDAGVQTFLKAIKRAQNAGIFVLTTSSFQYSDFMSKDTDFAGLGRTDLMGDADNLSSYTLGRFEQSDAETFVNKLLVPMDSRTTADPSGEADYVFYPDGGISWATPYVAGLYALAVQTKPDITPQIFWKTALNTSSKLTVTLNQKQYVLQHVINPTKLISTLK